MKFAKYLSTVALVIGMLVGGGSTASASEYVVENSWGSSSGHFGGLWVLGTRDNQLPVAFDIVSDDGGETFTGSMQYAGEGAIGFRAQNRGASVYEVQVQWGGASAPWHDSGYMIIGYRTSQSVIALNIASSDGGESFQGTMQYQGEGPIGFDGSLQ